MADVHTTKQRSYNMSRIKGKDTKPEMLVHKFLHANGSDAIVTNNNIIDRTIAIPAPLQQDINLTTLNDESS